MIYSLLAMLTSPTVGHDNLQSPLQCTIDPWAAHLGSGVITRSPLLDRLIMRSAIGLSEVESCYLNTHHLARVRWPATQVGQGYIYESRRRCSSCPSTYSTHQPLIARLFIDHTLIHITP